MSEQMEHTQSTTQLLWHKILLRFHIRYWVIPKHKIQEHSKGSEYLCCFECCLSFLRGVTLNGKLLKIFKQFPENMEC